MLLRPPAAALTTLLLASTSHRAPLPRCCSSHESTPDQTFADAYGDRLPSWLLDRVAALGFESPTAVQAESLDAVLDGHDVIIQAKTGSGKTLSYMLPLIAALRPQKSVQALVLLPTRELANQVALVARRLAAASPERLLVMALMDGSGAKRQRRWLVAEPPQVIVGNVQQVDSVLQARLLRLESLKLLVVDEVDACLADEATKMRLQRMLSGQLAIPIEQQRQQLQRQQEQAWDVRGSSGSRRSGAPPPSASLGEGLARRQTLFVSATLPQRQHFRRQCAQQRWSSEEPLLIHAEPTEVLPAQLRHGWAPCTPAKRVAALRVLLRRHEPELTGAIVFLPPNAPLRRLADALGGVVDDGPPPILADDEPMPKRAAAVRALRERSKRLLLSTTLGARGLDIPHCSHVYLVGLPTSAEAYTHAAGRCGRMGEPGMVTVLAGAKEEFALARLGNALGIEFFDARDAGAAPA